MTTDAELEVGDTVSILRARHGWYEGSVHGVITHRYKKNEKRETYSYTVEDEDGEEYDINRAGDLHKWTTK
jgi:hypothetical protein